jgi:hypothetical protein
MSNSYSKIEKIIHSPINTSKGKSTFSFSKGSRFDEIKLKGSKTLYYELPMMKNERYTSMGYGKKYDFVIKHINKRAPFYDLPSEFNLKKPTTPAFSFGIGREYYDKVIYNIYLIYLLNFIFDFI